MQFVDYIPKQKLPESKKDRQWHVDCIESGLALINSYDNTRRSTRYNKKINYDLYANIFHREDVAYVLNPLGLEENSVPAELRHYDVISPIFQLLFGEESTRIFNFMVRTVNEEAISDKEKAMKEMVYEMLWSKTVNDIKKNIGLKYDEKVAQQKIEEELARINKYVRYEYQDIREITATHIVKYLQHRLDFEKVMQDGWEDALIAGEEIYRVDVRNKEPYLRRCNPIEIYCLLPHNSYYIDDSDLIVEETWMSKGEIIDEFFEYLTDAEVEQIENGSAWSIAGNTLNYVNPVVLHTSDIPVIDAISNVHDYNSTLDSRGNIRIVRVTWKSRKKVGILSYMNPLSGETEEVVVSEDFKAEKGDNIEWKWISEYREGFKIGNSIYTRFGPCKIQRRRLEDISACKSPYIGTIYGGNNARSCSLMDRVKAYQYLYDIIWYRTELLIAKSIGKVMEFDLASIPREYGFDIDKWLYYLQAMNISFRNSFEESEKGVRLGMIGQTQATREINLEQGQHIDNHIKLLSFIEGKIADISGITPQRRGEIHNRELVGNVQQSITQSSYITEKYFAVHDHVKRRVLEAMLDVAKIAWRGSQKKIQYVTNDLSTLFLSVDGDDFDSAEYGLYISNSIKDNQALDSLKQLSQVGLQNDKLNFSQIMDIMLTDSVASTRRKIEQFEAEAEQRRQQEFDMQQKIQQENIAAQKEMKQAEMDLKKYEIDANNETRIQTAEINAFMRQEDIDIDNDGIPDPIEVGKLALEERRADSERYDKEHEKIQKTKEHNDNKSIKEKELKLKEKEINSKEKIEKLKAETALKIAKENKGKYDKKK